MDDGLALRLALPRGEGGEIKTSGKNRPRRRNPRPKQGLGFASSRCLIGWLPFAFLLIFFFTSPRGSKVLKAEEQGHPSPCVSPHWSVFPAVFIFFSLSFLARGGIKQGFYFILFFRFAHRGEGQEGRRARQGKGLAFRARPHLIGRFFLRQLFIFPLAPQKRWQRATKEGTAGEQGGMALLFALGPRSLRIGRSISFRRLPPPFEAAASALASTGRRSWSYAAASPLPARLGRIGAVLVQHPNLGGRNRYRCR